MKKFIVQTAVCFVLILSAAFVFAQVSRPSGPDDPKITSVRLLPGEPIVVSTCKVETSGGYLRPNDKPEPSDAQIGMWVRDQMKAGRIATIYPDKRGLFVTTECQK